MEFVIAGKPRDIIEAYHLLNLFTVSDYMRMINTQLHSGKIYTHEQNQEYIKLAGKTAEQYAKGMLSLKMHREGIPQIQNNKVQNNTLNQVNIHEHKTESKTKEIECRKSINAEEVAIKEKEEV